MANFIAFLVITCLLEVLVCRLLKHDRDLRDEVRPVIVFVTLVVPTISFGITFIGSVLTDIWYISLPVVLFIATSMSYIYTEEIKELVDGLKKSRKERKGK